MKSRILVIGDPHFRFELPYASAIEDGRRGEWDEVLRAIQEKAKECDAVVLLGDNLNTRHNHSSVIKDFVSFLEGLGDKEVHIIAGNHERYGKNTAIDFLQEMTQKTGWHIYTNEVSNTTVAGVKTTVVPFLTPGIVGAKDLEEAHHVVSAHMEPGKLCFLHHGISGASVKGHMVDTFREIIFSADELAAKYSLSIAGHIHERQWVAPKAYPNKLLHLGSMFTSEVGEHKKYMAVVTVEDDTVETEFCELPVRGIYGLNIREGEAVDNIPDHSIVKAVILDEGLRPLKDHIRARFSNADGVILIEQYSKERKKVSVEDGAKLSFTIPELIELYATSRNVSAAQLIRALTMIDEI